ncbi:hypothetical protein EAH87_15940 [Sphingomonas koreensis]|nr:hypothetical protein EAH87_15940 [Sphingomonas koreensis]
MIVIVSIVSALIVAAALTFPKFARSERWKATVTPLASIIGSGFLICGPILAREFGKAAILAEVLLLAIAYLVGWVIRFNIVHIENIKQRIGVHDPMAWGMRAAQATLAIAYAVSVAYYLKLLAEFAMKPLAVPEGLHAAISNGAVTLIILIFVLLTFSGSIRKIEHAAHATVSLKLAIIAGMLVALGLWWAMHGTTGPLPPAKIGWGSIPLLLGLLITVQGFETSRYMGEQYDQRTRVVTMRHAQWLSSAIYIAFLALLTPFLTQASHAEGVAGILDIMELVAPAMGIFVLIGAASSQLSAAIADSIGSGGLVIEVSQKKLGVRASFMASCALAIAVTWLTDPFSVIAWASRAFAAYYAMQAALALWVSIRTGEGCWWKRAGFVIVGLICVVAAAAGAPAES